MVTCSVPSSRSTMPTCEPETPWRTIREPGETSTGGHVTAQAPLQLDFEGRAVSLSNRYSVNPAPLTTTGLRSPADAAVSATHFIAAGALLGPWKKSPVLAGALLAFAVPLVKLTDAARATAWLL